MGVEVRWAGERKGGVKAHTMNFGLTIWKNETTLTERVRI